MGILGWRLRNLCLPMCEWYSPFWKPHSSKPRKQNKPHSNHFQKKYQIDLVVQMTGVPKWLDCVCDKQWYSTIVLTWQVCERIVYNREDLNEGPGTVSVYPSVWGSDDPYENYVTKKGRFRQKEPIWKFWDLSINLNTWQISFRERHQKF